MYLVSPSFSIIRLTGYLIYAYNPGSSSVNSFLFFLSLFHCGDDTGYIWVAYMTYVFGILWNVAAWKNAVLADSEHDQSLSFDSIEMVLL